MVFVIAILSIFGQYANLQYRTFFRAYVAKPAYGLLGRCVVVTSLNSALGIPHIPSRQSRNFNELMTAGLYSCIGQNTNAPTAGETHYIVLVIIDLDVKWFRQIALDVRSNAIYTRIAENNVFRKWNKITLTTS